MEIHTFKGVLKILLIPALVLFNAGFSAINYFNPEIAAAVPQKLSLTGIYTNKTITPEAIQYEVNVPQWTDSISSFRYLLVKAPGKILFGDTVDYYGYPDSVIFVRTLYIDTIKGNPASRKFFETRLLVKSPGKNVWHPFNYVWNSGQTDADFVGAEPLGVKYSITKASGIQTGRWSHDDTIGCIQCHFGRGVNGFFTAQLNRPSPANPLENQIKVLFEKGVFSGLPPTNFAALPKWAPPTDATAPIDVRVHSYFAAQCSQCHGTRHEIEAALEMKFDYHAMVDYSFVKTPPPPGVQPLIGLDSAIGHVATATVPDCSDDVKMIYKGDPGASLLYFRMSQRSENPDDFFPDINQMPPATSFMTDTEALNLVYKWICDMDPVLCALPPGQKKAGSEHEKCPDVVVDNPSGIIKRNRIIPFSLPLIENRVLHIPGQYTAGTHVEVFMTGINGREKRLTRVGKGLYKIEASVPAGVYFFKINEYSFKKVVF